MKLNSNIKLINQINGMKSKKPIKSEMIAREHARRSIVVTESIKKGDKFVENILTYKDQEMEYRLNIETSFRKKIKRFAKRPYFRMGTQNDAKD